MVMVWLIIVVGLVILECITVNLVSIWFAFGALIAAFVALFTDYWLLQVAVFVVVSIVSFIAMKPFANRFVRFRTERTNLDRVIGEIGIVTEDIGVLVLGEVKVDGKYWSAISKKEIKKGSRVEILSIEGVKLLVKEVKEEN